MFLKIMLLGLYLGGTTQTVHDKVLEHGLSATGGEVITAQSINAAKYTGWVYVGASKQLVLAIDYTQDAGSAVTMTCQSAADDSGANGSGYDIHTLTGGTSTLYTWSNAVSGNEKWTWTVYNVPLAWANCALTATGGGVDDVVTVDVVGVSP